MAYSVSASRVVQDSLTWWCLWAAVPLTWASSFVDFNSSVSLGIFFLECRCQRLVPPFISIKAPQPHIFTCFLEGTSHCSGVFLLIYLCLAWFFAFTKLESPKRSFSMLYPNPDGRPRPGCEEENSGNLSIMELSL